LEEVKFPKEQLFAWKRDGRRARARHDALELVTTARLKAEAKLLLDAANAVQQQWPRDCHHLEQVLWPHLQEYALTVFDDIARARLRQSAPSFSVRPYLHWLHCTCVTAVVEDVCRGGQLYRTAVHTFNVIGEIQWPPHAPETRRALAGIMTELLGGPHTNSIEKRLKTVLEARITQWEATAVETLASVTKDSGVSNTADRAIKVTEGKDESGASHPGPAPEKVANRRARSLLVETQFPERATWLGDRLRERAWSKYDVTRHGGPDQKTVQKILDGKHVREDALDRLVKALSAAPESKKLPKVNLLDIPRG
jgi:hypothetical protein